MDYTTAFSWITDNSTREQRNYFESLTDESEAIEYAESIGAYDPLDEFDD